MHPCIWDHYLYVFHSQVRLRVTAETFVDTGPSKPQGVQGAGGQEQEQDEARLPPYSLLGSCNEPGLGLLSWWTS